MVTTLIMAQLSYKQCHTQFTPSTQPLHLVTHLLILLLYTSAKNELLNLDI